MRHDGTAPVCRRCRRRHLAGLKCWGGAYAARLRGYVLATLGDVCHICGLPGARSVDHLVPRSHGGTDQLDNLKPAHLSCNVSRGTDPMPNPKPVTVMTSPRW